LAFSDSLFLFSKAVASKLEKAQQVKGLEMAIKEARDALAIVKGYISSSTEFVPSSFLHAFSHSINQ